MKYLIGCITGLQRKLCNAVPIGYGLAPMYSTVLTCTGPQVPNLLQLSSRYNHRSIRGPSHSSTVLTSRILSIAAAQTHQHTLAGMLSSQRSSLMDVLNCFGAFPLICFVWLHVYVCIDDLKKQEGRMGYRRRQWHRDKVRAPLHLCVLIRQDSHTNTLRQPYQSIKD